MKITTKTEALNIVETLFSISFVFIMGCIILSANWGSFIKVDFTPPNDLVALEKRN